MANYNQVSRGSGDKKTVMTLQEKLNEHGAGLQVDGIFGPATDKALRNYQTTKGLQVDGIAGEKTWAKLMGGSNAGNQQPQPTQQAAPAVPDYSAYQHDPSGNAAYNYANSMLEQAYKGVSTPTYDYDSVQAAYDKIVNRDKFKYDLNSDALYQQYKDQYTTQGKLAMMDAMGQAAALTGGYGSSFAQSAGQQAYQGYLQQLNEVIPELYGMAYDQYQQEGQDLLNQYAMTKEMADTKYGAEMDAQDAAWKAVNYWQGVANSEYDKDFNKWYTAQQLGTAADERQYERQQNKQNYMLNLIAAGYNPTDAELVDAGMTRSQATQWGNAHKQQVAASASGGDKVAKYNNPTYDRDKQWAADFANVDPNDEASAKAIWEQIVRLGYDPAYASDLYRIYFAERIVDNEN